MATNVSKGILYYEDHFTGPALDVTNDVSDGTENSGTAAANAQVGGVIRLTTGGTSGNRVSIGYGLHWQAQYGGPLRMEARIKSVTAITLRAYFVGFTDVLPETTLENPIEQSGTTLTSTADDAVGFMYDTDSTTDVWYCVGVKATVDTAAMTTGDAPKAAGTYENFAVEVDSDGNATFYKDGKRIGRIANAVSKDVSLTPVVLIETRDTAAISVDCDVLRCRGGLLQ